MFRARLGYTGRLWCESVVVTKARRSFLGFTPKFTPGLPPNLLLNILPSTPETKLSFVAPTAKPRLIQVSIKPAGEVPFTIGDSRRKAIDYILHVEIGGVAGVIAPLIGKQPADFHIWIFAGSSPAFIREEGQLYEGGPSGASNKSALSSLISSCRHIVS